MVRWWDVRAVRSCVHGLLELRGIDMSGDYLKQCMGMPTMAVEGHRATDSWLCTPRPVECTMVGVTMAMETALNAVSQPMGIVYEPQK